MASNGRLSLFRLTPKRGIILGLIALALYLLYAVRAVLPPFLASFVLVYLLEPVVSWLAAKTLFRLKISRGWSVFAVYVVVLSLLGLFVALVLPRIYHELLRIAHELPAQLSMLKSIWIPQLIDGLQSISDQYNLNFSAQRFFDDTISSLLATSESKADTLAESARHFISMLFEGFMALVLIFIVTAFLLKDMPMIGEAVKNLIPPTRREQAKLLVRDFNRDLSGAIRGQLLICLVNGVLTTIGLLVLNIKYAFTIGLIAGFFSLIPIFGSIISTVPAVLVAMTQGGWVVLQVLGMILIIHAIEANFLNPKIMGHQVELHPVIILFALFVGQHLFGIAGLLLAVPLAAILRSTGVFLYRTYLSYEQLEPLAVEEGAP